MRREMLNLAPQCCFDRSLQVYHRCCGALRGCVELLNRTRTLPRRRENTYERKLFVGVCWDLVPSGSAGTTSAQAES